MKALYNVIGDNYDHTRRADDYLVSRLIHHLAPNLKLKYVDLGCGTGNYTCRLFKQGINITGVDISSQMLAVATRKESNITWVKASVEDLPFEKGAFAGGIATLTIHHWPDLSAAFKEVARIIKGGNLVLFTSLPEQMRGYWLNYYFPTMMDRSIEQMPSRLRLQEAFKDAGMRIGAEEKYFVRPDLQDWFLYSGKFNPMVYMDSQRRAGISSFRKMCPPRELTKGLNQLEADIKSGRWHNLQKEYENRLGDYLFIKLLTTK